MVGGEYSTVWSNEGSRETFPAVAYAQNGIVSYYLFLVLQGIGITGTGNQTLINGILQVWNYAGAILGSLLVDRVGRRLLFLTSFGGMCLSFTAWTSSSSPILSILGKKLISPVCYATYVHSPVDTPNAAAGHGVLAFVFLYFAFYVVALTPLVISYPVELWVITAIETSISSVLRANQS